MSGRGHLRVDAELNTTGFQQTLNGMKQSAQRLGGELGKSWSVGTLFKGGLAGITGALSFEGIKASLESFINRAKEIKEVSEQLEIGTDETQKWEKAFGRLGGSAGAMINVLGAMKQKAAEAVNDPKTAELFSRLGVSRESVLNAYHGKNISEFLEQSMAGGRGTPDQRLAYRELFGARAGRFAGAGELFGGMHANMSPEAIRQAERVERAEKQFKGFFTSVWSGLLTGKNARGEALFQNRFDKEAAKNAPNAADEARFRSAREQNLARWAKAKGKTEPTEPDPLEAILAAKEEERQDTANRDRDRIESARRQNMTSYEKKRSIEAQLKRLGEEREEIDMRQAPSNLTAEETKDWRTKNEHKAAELTATMEGLKGDLMEKPMQVTANNLAKSGLFTGSALNVQDERNIPKEQLKVLQTIARNTGGNKFSGVP